jgi:hypothetical protein
MDRRGRAREIIDLIYLEQDRFGDIVPDEFKRIVIE